MRNSGVFALISATTLLVFLTVSCTPLEIKKTPTQNKNSFKFSSQQNGLKISVDPYKEEGRLNEFFGCDLFSRGILPVFVFVENLSADDGYIIVSDKASLLTSGSLIGKEQAGEGQMSEEAGKASKNFQSTNQMAAAAPLFGVVGLAFLPLGLTSEKQYRDEIEIRKNIEQKQITPKTIYSGGSQSGFFYFNTGKEQDQIKGIQFGLKNIRTRELSFITINMEKF